MIEIPSMTIDAAFGCVPPAIDNLAECTRLFGAERAASIVGKTGFSNRRVAGPGTSVVDMAEIAARKALDGVDGASVGGVVFVTFSAPNRYPSASGELAHRLGLPGDIPALDISLACAGYPYGLMVAGNIAAACGKAVLLADGDVQTAYVAENDAATTAVMGDGATATIVRGGGKPARFGFISDSSRASSLACPANGPVSMTGFDVFRFVMTDVVRFVGDFVSRTGGTPDVFVPHQANLYMIRQLADAVGLGDRLLVSGDSCGNPGSASLPMTLAAAEGVAGGADVVLAGFGAGLSASAARLALAPDFRRGIVEIVGN